MKKWAAFPLVGLWLSALSGCHGVDRWQVRAAVTRHLQDVIAESANEYLNRYGRYSYSPTEQDEAPELIEVRNVVLTDYSIHFPSGGGAEAKVSWRCQYRGTKEYEKKLKELAEKVEGQGADSWYPSVSDRDLYSMLKSSHAPDWTPMAVFALKRDQEKYDEEQEAKSKSAADKGKQAKSEAQLGEGATTSKPNKLRDDVIRNRTISFRLRHYHRTGWRVES